MNTSAAIPNRYLRAPQESAASVKMAVTENRKPSKPLAILRFPYGVGSAQAAASASNELRGVLLVSGALAMTAAFSAGMLARIMAKSVSETRKELPDAVTRTLRSFAGPGARHKVGALVLDVAERALDCIRTSGLSVERVVSTADGEVAFYFVGRQLTPGGAHRRYGTVVCDEDGALTALCEDRVSRETKVWDVPAGELDEALGIIGSFIRG